MRMLSSDLLIASLVSTMQSFLFSSPMRNFILPSKAEMQRSQTSGQARNMEEIVLETVRDEGGLSHGDDNSSPSASLHNDPWSGEQLQLERVTQNASNSQFRPYMLILVGLPGSGKSTFARTLESTMHFKFARVNQDEMKTRKKCVKNAERAMSNGFCVIVDRCNFDSSQREVWYDLAAKHNYPVDCVVFSVPTPLCIQRCQQRSSHETIRPKEAAGIVRMIEKQLKIPSEDEKVRFVRNLQVLRSSLQVNDALSHHLHQK